MLTAYVVTWRYTDGSGSGVVSVHWTQQAAERLCRILSTHGDTMKTYSVAAVPAAEVRS